MKSKVGCPVFSQGGDVQFGIDQVIPFGKHSGFGAKKGFAALNPRADAESFFWNELNAFAEGLY
jgi:hypothetical protein